MPVKPTSFIAATAVLMLVQAASAGELVTLGDDQLDAITAGQADLTILPDPTPSLLAKLSSGSRIVKVSDDAASL